MVIEAGVEWPNKLQAAVLAANRSWKRATKFTPSFLMCGREANCAHLLERVPFSDDEVILPFCSIYCLVLLTSLAITGLQSWWYFSNSYFQFTIKKHMYSHKDKSQACCGILALDQVDYWEVSYMLSNFKTSFAVLFLRGRTAQNFER